MDKFLVGFWFSFLGALFFFYIFLLALLDPDRLHIIHHEDKEEDSHLQFTAWVTAFLCFMTYGTGAAILGYIKYYPKQDTSMDKMIKN
jgi:hypothetical protein